MTYKTRTASATPLQRQQPAPTTPLQHTRYAPTTPPQQQRHAPATPLKHTRYAPATPLKRKELAPRVAAKLIANNQLSADIPCFIDIVESVSLAPGKSLTYNIRWNGGDSMANEFVVDWYAHPNWEALGLRPLASSVILPRVTFMPEHPFSQSTETWTGTITFDVPLNITYTQLFAVLSLAKTN